MGEIETIYCDEINPDFITDMRDLYKGESVRIVGNSIDFKSYSEYDTVGKWCDANCDRRSVRSKKILKNWSYDGRLKEYGDRVVLMAEYR